MDRFLVDYLPQFMQEYKEIKAIMDAEQPFIEAQWTNLDKLLDEAFITTESEYGAAVWEEILGIKPMDTDTVSERNFRIRSKLVSNLPYSWRNLERMLAAICGEKGYSISLSDEKGISLKIKLSVSNIKNFATVSELLDEIVPANIIIAVVLMYNQQKRYNSMTHGELRAYTHYELRADERFEE